MSEKIDLSSIQYVPPVEAKETPKEAKVDVNAMMSEAKKVKKAMAKENKKLNEQETEQQAMDKQRLIAILQIYLIDFNDRLGQFKKTNLQKMSFEELQDLRKVFDGIISSKSSLKQSQAMVLSGIRMLEECATKFTPIRCQGLYVALSKDPDTLDDIKHISLKRMGLVATEPEMRLLWTITQTIMGLHAINSDNHINNEKISEVNQKYNDL